jgi:hypothetical protein
MDKEEKKVPVTKESPNPGDNGEDEGDLSKKT